MGLTKRMETLSLDFNRLDDQGRVRIGPEAERHNHAVCQKLEWYERVLVVDDDGSSCEGVLEQGEEIVRGPGGGVRARAVVRLDMATWRDAPED